MRIGDFLAVWDLLDKGADPSEEGNDGCTAAGLACHFGVNGALDIMLKKGLDPSLASADGTSLLHIAAQRGKRTVVEQLLSAGAQRDVTDGQQKTPLDVAHRSVRDLLQSLTKDDHRDGIIRFDSMIRVGDQVLCLKDGSWWPGRLRSFHGGRQGEGDGSYSHAAVSFCGWGRK